MCSWADELDYGDCVCVSPAQLAPDWLLLCAEKGGSMCDATFLPAASLPVPSTSIGIDCSSSPPKCIITEHYYHDYCCCCRRYIWAARSWVKPSQSVSQLPLSSGRRWWWWPNLGRRIFLPLCHCRCLPLINLLFSVVDIVWAPLCTRWTSCRRRRRRRVVILLIVCVCFTFLAYFCRQTGVLSFFPGGSFRCCCCCLHLNLFTSICCVRLMAHSLLFPFFFSVLCNSIGWLHYKPIMVSALLCSCCCCFCCSCSWLA